MSGTVDVLVSGTADALRRVLTVGSGRYGGLWALHRASSPCLLLALSPYRPLALSPLLPFAPSPLRPLALSILRRNPFPGEMGTRTARR